jgi:Domain of unknown function (DUF4349)
MSEASFDMVLQELRDTAPRAPERLRNLVNTLPAAQPRRSLRLRPALSAAIALAIAVGLGAAIIGGFTESPPNTPARFAPAPTALEKMSGRNSTTELPGTTDQKRAWDATGGTTLAPSLTAKSRLQKHDVAMRLRVDDLSRATQTAVRQTRNLGGYVAAADYATDEAEGDSLLDLRVPVQNVQTAIARFTDLGTLLAQRISVADLQSGVDRIDRRLMAARKVITELEAKSTLTPDEQARLDAARRTVQRLTRNRNSLVQQATYANISLQLTTTKPAAKQEEPGRFDRFWGDAGDILGKEAIAVLYALVIVGPFAILAALAFFAGRARRRRADHRLLEETG